MSFFSETTFTARSAGTGSPSAPGFNPEVERLIARYDANDFFKLSFGRYHTPINYWNTGFPSRAEAEFKRAIARSKLSHRASLVRRFPEHHGPFRRSPGAACQSGGSQPALPGYWLALASRLYYARQYAAAIEQCQKPSPWSPLLYRPTTFWAKHTLLLATFLRLWRN